MSRSLWAGLAFGAVFLALAFWGVPLGELGEALGDLRPLPLLPLAAVFLLQQAVRALRQQVLARSAAPDAGFRSHLAILCMSFFCINVFPARLGELARLVLLRRNEGVPVAAGVGVVVAERTVDLVGLLVASLVVMLTADVAEVPVSLPGGEVPLGRLVERIALGAMLPLLVALALFLALGGAFARTVVEALARGAAGGWRQRLLPVGRVAESWTRALGEGLASLRHPVRLAQVALLTAVSFFAMGVTAWLGALAFGLGDRIGVLEGTGVLCVTMLGIALPAPPGFAGVFEASFRAGLALFGVYGAGLDSRALAFALVYHWWTFLVQAASAAWFFWTDGVDPRTLLREIRSAREPGADSGAA